MSFPAARSSAAHRPFAAHRLWAPYSQQYCCARRPGQHLLSTIC